MDYKPILDQGRAFALGRSAGKPVKVKAKVKAKAADQ